MREKEKLVEIVKWMAGSINDKVKEKEKKVTINGYRLFVWEVRKKKYGRFL